MSKVVAGSTHGEQRSAHACNHVVQTLHECRPQGFLRSEGMPDGDCAWCSTCEEKRFGTGEGRTDEPTDRMNIALLCGSRFGTARRTNGVFN